MVRRIRSCSTCSVRFVALANAEHCQNCHRLSALPVQARDETKQASNISVIDIVELEQNAKEAHEIDGEDVSLQDIESEGDDDVQCSQVQFDDNEGCDRDDDSIVEIDGDNDDSVVEIEELNTQKEQNSAKTLTDNNNSNLPPTTSNFQTADPCTKDTCFICGMPLAKLKRRLDHIKRCSRKYSITGRDVKADTDMEAFQEATTIRVKSAAAKDRTNPYTRESSWHGDSALALRLASEDNNNKRTVESSQEAQTTAKADSKQSLLSSFFQNSVIRNVNNVLVAGARRLTMVEKLQTSYAQQRKKEPPSASGSKRKRESWMNRQPFTSNRECPMYKKIPGTDFVCDGFHYAKRSLTKNYFLTHFHSDHYGGITNTWDIGIIYCSLPTATLVSQQLGTDKKYLHPLPMNTPTIIASRGKPVTVTLLDANHCPGAVMFLFEVGKRRILHVGDFRWDRNLMMQQPPLRQLASNAGLLDDLFLDTTYCNPKYSLPSQEQAIAAVLSIFDKEMQLCQANGNSKTLHLFGAYTIGKEKMYLSIAERFNLKVYVDHRRYKILSSFNWSEGRMSLLTTVKEEASIWVVPLGDINMKKLPEYLASANEKPFAKHYSRVMGYRPTGWSMGSKPSSGVLSSRYSGNMGIHSVPYSEHSSFPELVECLACLKPRRIIPTVNAGKSDVQVQCLLKAMREKQTTLDTFSAADQTRN